MEYREIMRRLGFGKNAHNIYAALLSRREPLLVTEIAAISGIGRPEIYRNLKNLIAQKFIRSEARGKRKVYLAEDPECITRAFAVATKDAEHEVEKLKAKAEKLLPAHIRYYSGPLGIRTVFDDAIAKTPKGGTFYRYTSERDLAKVNRYLSPTYRTLRDKKKLERLVISNPVSGKQKRSRLERFIKYIPGESGVFDQNIIQLVYADYLAFINLSSEEAFIIRDAALAQFQSVIFNQLYKKL